mmetsp:Transcript_21649/g.28031  ORF Transcript_21649/g.28031 Transcript_21649/m.28031 type:complete len:613 (-) Transcript_21649:40-1878(-)
MRASIRNNLVLVLFAPLLFVEISAFHIASHRYESHGLRSQFASRLPTDIFPPKDMGNWQFQLGSTSNHEATENEISEGLETPTSINLGKSEPAFINLEKPEPSTSAPPSKAQEQLPTQKKRNRPRVPRQKFPPAFTQLIQCLKNQDVQGGLAAYEELKEGMEELKMRIPEHAYNGILNLCGTTEYVDQGKQVLEEMIAAGHKPQENSYKFLIVECCSRNYSYGAMVHVNKMIEEGLTPRLRSYAPILKILSETHRSEEILEVWDHMVSHNVTAKEEQYLQMVDCFGGAGVLFQEWYLEWVNKLFNSLKEEVFGLSEKSFEILQEWFGEKTFASAPQVPPPAVVVLPEETGICPNCGGQLQAVGLEIEEKQKVKEALLQMAGEQEELQTEYLRLFAEWLDLREPYSVVIDAANVAYANQNVVGGGFSHQQIDMIAKQLESQGERVLIVIPERYMRDRVPNTSRHRKHKKQAVTEKAKALMEEWKQKGDIYIVSDGANDDWYWMYSSVAIDKFPSMVVSNDKMRDHRLSLLAPRPFYRWKNTQIMNYRFAWPEDEERNDDNVSVEVINPPVYSREIQCTTNKVWHFPLNVSEDAENKEWLCVHTQYNEDKKNNV